MTMKQLSVFVENKPGTLAEITGILGENGIDMCALSVADTERPVSSVLTRPIPRRKN